MALFWRMIPLQHLVWRGVWHIKHPSLSHLCVMLPFLLGGHFMLFSSQVHHKILIAFSKLPSTLLPAAINHLPEVPDHHADPDPGPAAVCCAALPHSWGITHIKTPSCDSYASAQIVCELPQWCCASSTERPPGYPALAQLVRGQPAPADRPAGLQRAQQGWFNWVNRRARPVHTHVDVSSKCSFSFVVWPFVHANRLLGH